MLIRRINDNKPYQRYRVTYKLIFAIGVFAISCAGYIDAQEIAKTPIAPQTSPHLPSSFDQVTIQEILADIEKPRAASTLKIGYFARRGQPNFPFEQALALIDAAIAEEPSGSKRWFELQNVKAYAILRTKVSTPREGMSAYAAIFDAADKAAESNALYPLRVSIAEYATYVSVANNKDIVQREPLASTTLLKGWNAYALTADMPMKGHTSPPDFVHAFAAICSNERAIHIIEKTLIDPNVPRSLELLMTGASFVAAEEPEKAIVWLRQAKPLLPSASAPHVDLMPLALNETARFYDLLVNVLEKNNHLTEAIAEQRERIAKVSGGYGRLWVLLAHNGDANGQRAVVVQLKSPNVRGYEVLRAANVMGQFTQLAEPITGGPEAGADVLQAFLLLGRTRTPEEEMQSRIWLNAYFTRHNQIEKARDIIIMPEPHQLTPQGRLLWADLQRLLKAVSTWGTVNVK